ncbi:MAG: phage portal protein, partial [Prevotellaceae bacterium]|nr:phage portal protein [Prevotellaceae bacterium]
MGAFINFFRKITGRGAAGVQTRSADTASAARLGVYSLLNPTWPALNIPTVYRCVEVIADSVAALPLRCLRYSGGRFVEDTTTDLPYLLNVQPDSYLSAPDFWKMAVRHLLLRGNAYIVPIYGAAGDVLRLALPSPGCVSHDTTTDTYRISDTVSGVYGTFGEAQVIHLKNFSNDGKAGISTLAHAANTIRIAGTGGSEIENRFANGGRIKGFVGNDTTTKGFGEYADKQLEQLAVDVDSQFRAGKDIVSLPGQVHFASVSLSSTDMQFLETMKFSNQEICRFFGVPPSFVFADTSTNYKSAENAQAILLTQTVGPILRMIEAELLRKLVPPTLAFRRAFRFDTESMFAADPAARVAYQKATIEAGLYTVNDWRRRENREPVEGGD